MSQERSGDVEALVLEEEDRPSSSSFSFSSSADSIEGAGDRHAGLVDGRRDWLDITALISTSLPDGGSQEFLGDLVLVAQGASDRAIALARAEADAVIAAATKRAEAIRTDGRQRARALGRLRAVARQRSGRVPLAGSFNGVVQTPMAQETIAGDELSIPAPPRPSELADTDSDSRLGVPPRGDLFEPSDRPRVGPPGVGRPGAGRGPTPLEPVSIEVASFATRYYLRSERTEAPPPDAAVWSLADWQRGQDATTVETRSPLDRGSKRHDRAAIRRSIVPWLDYPAARPLVGCAVVAAMVALFVAGFSIFERDVTAVREHRAQQHLVAQFVRIGAGTSTDASANPPSGTPVALLSVPRLAMLNEAIVEGATLGHLREGPAHASTSQLPGRPGTVVILGHHRTYGGPFSQLGALRVGDVISVRTASGLYAYRVSRSRQVLGSDGSATFQLPTPNELSAGGGNADDAGRALILATSAGSSGDRLEVVVANLEHASSQVGTIGTDSGSASALFESVSGQRSGLIFAVFWALLVLGLAWSVRRFWARPPPALVIAVALVLTSFAISNMYGALIRVFPGTY